MKPSPTRVLATAIALGVSLAGAAGARPQKIPSASTSTVPRHVVIVGLAGGVPDAGLGGIVVIPRDFANNEIPGCTIWLDFSQCADARESSESLDPDVSVDCANRRWRTVADGLGVARLTVLGGSTGASCSGSSRVRIYGDGAWIGSVPVAIYDLDGNGGLNSADLSLWMDDYGSGDMRERSDYDGSGHLDSSDLASWLTAYALGGSAESPATYCP